MKTYKVDVRTLFRDVPMDSPDNRCYSQADLHDKVKGLSFVFHDEMTERGLRFIIRKALEQVEEALFQDCKVALEENKD